MTDGDSPAHVLVVAHKTAESPALLEVVRARTARSTARSRRATTRWRPSKSALLENDFDEVILSTLPRSISRWLHIDLPRRVAHLGLPVMTVIADERDAATLG